MPQRFGWPTSIKKMRVAVLGGALILVAAVGQPFLMALLTSGALMLFLGLNIASTGFVFLTSGWLRMLLELLLLILVLNFAYVLVLIILSFSWLGKSRRETSST